MTAVRDWITTLWPASYKGFAFFLDSDDEEGGRDKIIHKFPNRDLPYIEDLGEEPRFYSGAAYVHGDDADAQANAFATILASAGPGTLVLPIKGPVLVHALPFKRRHEKDKLGYAAFEVKFVREGAPFALISLPALANAAHGAADALAAAAAATFTATVALNGVPDHVEAAAYDTVALAASTLDALRLSNAVDPAASATLRDRLADLVAATAAVAPASDLAVPLVAATRDLADAMAPDLAARVMRDVVEGFPPLMPAARRTAWAERAARNEDAGARLARLAALTGFAEAILRRAFVSRPDGVAARSEIAARFEAELEAASGAENAALYVAIAELRGRVVDYLSRVIADLAPVITVSAPARLPSLYWAWRLYGDPQRAAEIVARNQVRHPSFMPETFGALAR